MADPSGDDCPDARRHSDMERGRVGDLHQSPLGGQETDGLADEERVPVRGLGDGRGETS